MIGLFHCPARSIQKFVLIAKMSLEEHFETHLKEKYAKRHLHNVVSQFLAPFFSCKFSD